ncbi:MAG TPA: hypothetical protein VKS21_00615, partial [Spirochaetota bacterium]|nr:hypothetical protein [Spirochaetota bacterium]
MMPRFITFCLLFTLLSTIITAEKPKIAVLSSKKSIEFMHNKKGKNLKPDAFITKKEISKMNYKVDLITEKELVDSSIMAEYKLLVLPFSQILTWKERRAIKKFNRDGGALIAGWKVGEFDQDGETADYDDMGELFGYEAVKYDIDPKLGVGQIQRYMHYKFVNVTNTWFVIIRKERAAAYYGEVWQ